MATARSKKSEPKRRRTPSSENKAGTGERLLKIGEAARLLGVEAYVLRFWETQFPFLRPRHASSSHRMYEAKDIELLRVVQRLLHVEGYTIAGATKQIREVGLDRLRGEPAKQSPRTPAESTVQSDNVHRIDVQRTLDAIRDDLKSLHKLLDN
jgi:DNA-binding transcriptional MerR regulator